MCVGKRLLTVFVVVWVGCLFGGCRKGEEKSLGRAKPRGGAEVGRAVVRNACEKAVGDFLEAVAAKDFVAAVEHIDVEGMLDEGRKETAESTAYSPSDAEEMKEKLRLMMEKGAGAQEGDFSYKILGSEVSEEKAKVSVEIYRGGELVEKEVYPLTKRGKEWKLAGWAAIRPLMPKMPEQPFPLGEDAR